MSLKNNTIIVIILSVLSAAIYLVQNLLFHKPEDTFFYLFQDLAFVPVQAIIATLILNKLLNIIEKQLTLKKLHVVVSSFFAVTGTSLLNALADQNKNNDQLYGLFTSDIFKDKRKFRALKKELESFHYDIDVTPESLEILREVLTQNMPDLLNLLQNSNLHEHDSFTDMLWPIYHVADELNSRGSLVCLSPQDLAHLKRDITRAYPRLIIEWINYLKYLSSNYPYMFNSAIRNNPFKQYAA